MKILTNSIITVLALFTTSSHGKKVTPQESLLQDFNEASIVIFADYRTDGDDSWITPLEVWKGESIEVGVETRIFGKNIEFGPSWKERGSPSAIRGQAVFMIRAQPIFGAMTIHRFENGKMKFGGFPMDKFKALLPLTKKDN